MADKRNDGAPVPPADDDRQAERLASLTELCRALTQESFAETPVAEPSKAAPPPEPRRHAASTAEAPKPPAPPPEPEDPFTASQLPEFLGPAPPELPVAQTARRTFLPGRRHVTPALIVASLAMVTSAAVAGAAYVSDLGFVTELVTRGPEPRISAANANGVEDTVIPLEIAVDPADGTALSEVVIAGVPDGGALSAGFQMAPGTWLLAPDSLDELSFVPPRHYNGTLFLIVTAKATQGEEPVESSRHMTVVVDANADTPSLGVADVSGREDAPLKLGIEAAVNDPKEALALAIAGVPEDATVSHGEPIDDGIWSIPVDALPDLAITPPANFTGSFSLRVTAVAIDHDAEAALSRTMDVTIRPVADRPVLTATIGPASEDTPIPITIDAAAADPAERLTLLVAGLPDGAALSAGQHQPDGDWRLTADDLAGLALLPPADFNGDLAFSVVATTVDGPDKSQARVDRVVAVAPVPDQPQIDIAAAAGREDQTIPLSITARPGAANEQLRLDVTGVPPGATLSAGTDRGEGTWTLDLADLADLQLQPPADFAGEFAIVIVATAQDGDATATHREPLQIAVGPVADPPALSVAAANGAEDTPIGLPIDASTTDDSEEIAVRIGDLPTGATLSAGTPDQTGTWTVPATALADLSLIPAENFSGTFDLSVIATARDGADVAERQATLAVDIAAIADPAVLVAGDVSGQEDQPIAVAVAARAADPSEQLSVWLESLPDGIQPSVGRRADGDRWSIPLRDLDELTLTTAPNYNGEFTFAVVAETADNADISRTRQPIHVIIAPVADAPNLQVADAAGLEDERIALAIDAASVAAGETVAVVVDGLPTGATLSAGEVTGADAPWRIAGTDLDGLYLLPPPDFSGAFELEVVAESQDGTDRAATRATVAVAVAPVADSPSLVLKDAVGTEDEPIPLIIRPTPGDVSELLTIAISGLPTGASLTAGQADDDGTWLLAPGDLAGLSLSPPPDFFGELSLNVEVIATDGDTRASVERNLVAAIAGVVDAPTLTARSTTGDEDTTIPLAIAAAPQDPSETLELVVRGLPDGATLSAGTAVDDNWVLAAADLTDLTLAPPTNFSGQLDLQVVATAVASDDRAVSEVALAVDLRPVADDPVLTAAPAAGAEDTAIPLNIAAAVADPSESIALEVVGMPDGAALSAGAAVDADRWSLSPPDLDGLTLAPPPNYSGPIALTVAALVVDGDDQIQTNVPLDIVVAPVADPPFLTVAATTAPEDTAAPIEISTELVDPSEALTIAVTGVPDGARLSAGQPTADGSWVLAPDELAALTFTPPADFSGDISLDVAATTVDGEDAAVVSSTLDVTVTPVADAPELRVADATGTEDTAIPLDIAAAATDPSENVAIRLAGLPPTAALSAGTADDDIWSLTPDDLSGLSLTPPPDFDGTLELSALAVARDGDDVTEVEQTFRIAVAPAADTPQLATQSAAGSEDEPIELAIDAAATDPSETLSVAVAGLPAGASLTAGTASEDGTYVLAPDELTALALLPPENFSGEFSLAVAATAADGADTATVEAQLQVAVAAVADNPTVDVASILLGEEDTTTPLVLDVSSSDPSETLAITIAGLPPGTRLSAGDPLPVPDALDVWQIDPADLGSLSLTPPPDFSGQIPLEVVVDVTDGDATRAARSTTIVSVLPRADQPELEVRDALGIEDGTVVLQLEAATTDPSEQLVVKLHQVPDTARLSAGAKMDNGVWRLTANDLPGLAMQLPPDFNGRMRLITAATAIDGGDTATRELPLEVIVAPVAEPPVLTTDRVTGDAGTPIRLAATVPSGAATEQVVATVSGLPSGAVLSAGEPQADGLWSLDKADFADLAVTPPADYQGTMSLAFKITAIDGNDRKDVEQQVAVVVGEPAAAVTTAAAAPAPEPAPAPAPPPAAEAAPPVAAAPPPPDVEPPAMSDQELAEFTERGNALLRIGDIFSARLMFELAANGGSPAAAVGLAKTYDPLYFQEAGVVGATAKPEVALRWYARASEQGNAEALERLTNLRRWSGIEDEPNSIGPGEPTPVPPAPTGTATARRAS